MIREPAGDQGSGSEVANQEVLEIAERNRGIKRRCAGAKEEETVVVNGIEAAHVAAIKPATKAEIVIRVHPAQGFEEGDPIREAGHGSTRSEEHTSELQSLTNPVCRLL